jgi:hypothetical protein
VAGRGIVLEEPSAIAIDCPPAAHVASPPRPAPPPTPADHPAARSAPPGPAAATAAGVESGTRPNATVLIEEAANGDCGIGDNVPTLTTRNEHKRTGVQRGAFGSYQDRSYQAPKGTR